MNYLPSVLREAIYSGLTIGVDRLADRSSGLCRWDMGYEKISSTFTRFALPIMWDFCEGNPLSETTGNYAANLEWVAEYIEHGMRAGLDAPSPVVRQQSAIVEHTGGYDCVVTDPPYYDAIPYSDLMDFFYIWLRRSQAEVSEVVERAFSTPWLPNGTPSKMMGN